MSVMPTNLFESAYPNSSLPGLTRQSLLHLRLCVLSRKQSRHVSMDARVKPALDDHYALIFSISASETSKLA